jgi:hypothetical protein
MGIDLFGQQDFRKFHFGGYKLALSSITFGEQIFKRWEKLRFVKFPPSFSNHLACV